MFVLTITTGHLRYDVNRNREDNGTVVIGGNVVQSLEIPQLQCSRAVAYYICSMFESSRSLMFSLSSNDFSSCFSGSFSLSSHGALKILRNSDILYFNSLNFHSPRL